MAQLVGDTSRLMATPKPQPVRLHKRKTTLQRLSALFPSLINSQPTDHPDGQAVHRKPLPPDSHAQELLVQENASPTFDLSFDFNNESKAAAHSNIKDWFSLGHSSHPGAPDMQHHHHDRTPSDSHPPGSPTARLHKRIPAMPDSPPPPPPRSAQLSPPPDATFSFTETKPSPGLAQREYPSHRRRSSSIAPQTSPNLVPEQAPQSNDPRGRSVSAQPPVNRPDSGPTGVVVSTAGSRPGSSNGSQSPNRETERRGRLRRSWLPRGRSRSHSGDVANARTGAWILDQNQDYNTSFLVSGEKVPELWNEAGAIYVFLQPKGTGMGPSFKVPSFAVESSLVFADLIEAEMASPTSSGRSRTRSFNGRDSLSVEDARRLSQSILPVSDFQGVGESRLYLPAPMSESGHASQPDLERLVSIRNMFAFLTGQPLVGTGSQPTLFKVMLNVAALLREFEFTNADGSTYGEAVNMSFGFLMDQMALADVRQSREKTLEALILGEQMRSMTLYNEAFAHGAGKYPAIRDLKSPLWDQLSPNTRQRLERAYLDLVSRQNSVNNRLESFEFPALFSGVASSASTYRDVKFNVWKRSFNRMRQFVLGHYKASFGSWPPKARSKKNPFTESGLNRLVLKILYLDLCALYDLLVDRESITTRVIDQSVEEIAHDSENPHASALRRILSEFDQSSPPVLPPIPFDLPKLPDMISIQENFYDLPPKDQARLEKDLQDYQLLLILNKAYDFETYKLEIPFLEGFKEFEHKEAKGKLVGEIADQRIGYWLFLYVVIQTLPMVVVDAPGVQFTEGVEYFLCQPAKGNPPWIGDGGSLRKRWYEVPGGGGLVELSEDAVEFGIEGIYQRSHCWLAAKQWEISRERALAPPPPEGLSPLQAPQSVFEDMDPRRSVSPPTGPPGLAVQPRTGSPGDRSSYRKSIVLGLEPVALPIDNGSAGSRVVSARGGSPGPRPMSLLMNRSRSSGNLYDPSVVSQQASPQTDSRQGSVGGSTFDDILKDMDTKPKKKRMFF